MGIKSAFRYWTTRLIGWWQPDNKNKDGDNMAKKTKGKSSKVVSIVKAPGVPDRVMVSGSQTIPGPVAKTVKPVAKPKTKEQLKQEALEAEAKRKVQEQAEPKVIKVDAALDTVKAKPAAPIMGSQVPAAGPSRRQLMAARKQYRIMGSRTRITPARPRIGR